MGRFSSLLLNPVSPCLPRYFLKMDYDLQPKKGRPLWAAINCGRSKTFACLTSKTSMLKGTPSTPPHMEELPGNQRLRSSYWRPPPCSPPPPPSHPAPPFHPISLYVPLLTPPHLHP